MTHLPGTLTWITEYISTWIGRHFYQESSPERLNTSTWIGRHFYLIGLPG